MSRSLRIQYPGAIYHVMTLGNDRKSIFLDERDRRFFLHSLAAILDEYNAVLYAYCLMSTHYHLLVETRDPNLAMLMRQVNGIYSRWFNHRHVQVGHVFKGRYVSRLVERQTYLLEVSRYIALNPVRAGMVRRPELFAWSGYRATAGYDPSPEWLSRGAVLEMVGGRNRRERERRYRGFVLEGLRGMENTPAGPAMPAVWGSDRFQQKLRKQARPSTGKREISRAQRFVGRPPLGELVDRVRGRDERDRAIWRAYKACGYSMTAIGGQLGLSCSRVSRIVEEQRQKARPGTKVGGR